MADGLLTQTTQVIPELQANYNNLLALNQQNYGNILGAYQGSAYQLAGQLPGLYAGYGQLSADVTNTLGLGAALGGTNWGVAAPAAEAIRTTLNQQQGQTTQNLISRGLGNTTVAGSLAGQNAYQAAQAYGQLGAQLAQQAAGYQSSIGLAGLQTQLQGVGLQNSLNQAYLNALAGYRYTNPYGSVTGQSVPTSSLLPRPVGGGLQIRGESGPLRSGGGGGGPGGGGGAYGLAAAPGGGNPFAADPNYAAALSAYRLGSADYGSASSGGGGFYTDLSGYGQAGATAAASPAQDWEYPWTADWNTTGYTTPAGDWYYPDDSSYYEGTYFDPGSYTSTGDWYYPDESSYYDTGYYDDASYYDTGYYDYSSAYGGYW